MSEWRVAQRLPWTMVMAVLAGWIGADLGLRSRYGLARAGAFVITTGLILCVLSGWPLDDPYHVPDPRSQRGLASLGVLFVGALCLAGLLFRSRRSERIEAFARARLVAGGALFLTIAIPTAYHVARGRVSENMLVREVVRDLLAETPAPWTIASAHPTTAPDVGVIAPDATSRYDVGELPALIMPPSSR